MDIIQQLTLALGLGSLAGVSLYLTVALTGIALNMNLLTLAGDNQALQILEHPAVITVACALFALEFFADKIQGFDSVWDSVHTFIRPVGATLVAIQALGTVDPALQVIAGLLAGGSALVTHTAKAGLRVAVNSSPEPLSNMAVSAAEDVAVVGLFTLLAATFNNYPWISLIVFSTILLGLIWVMPRAFRLIRANVVLLWKKLGLSRSEGDSLPQVLTPDEDMLVAKALGTDAFTVAWSLPAISGNAKGIAGWRNNLFGTVVAIHEHPDTLVFLAKRRFHRMPLSFQIDGTEVHQTSRFLSENLTLFNRSRQTRMMFRFPRPDAGFVNRIADALRSRSAGRAGQMVVAMIEPELEPSAATPEPTNRSAAYSLN
ncbi:MAG: DUF4126 domain-containing protein [Verrucomicrobia bacterium]|nr:DUF4126 domain-containing protein [Verrucomicrobiota bacterium]